MEGTLIPCRGVDRETGVESEEGGDTTGNRRTEGTTRGL